MSKISNIMCGRYIQNLRPFQGSNLFAEMRGRVYVIYSYEHHFPIYANIQTIWYGNSDKVSQSTSRHQSLAKPKVKEIIWVTTKELKNLVTENY